jgi:predicted MFS family arabinose efflux permease
VVSLFADFTYEGSRSIVGPYLAVLGASATAVGIIAGLGELLGYGLRLVSGRLSERTRQFWPITLVGYFIQMFSVPLLALAGNWPVAAVLIITERVGKAIRNPPRDVMLSHAARQMGYGWGFGVHEALDQLGALIGPLVLALVLAYHHKLKVAFAVLALPALVTLGVLLAARFLYPRPEEMEEKPPEERTQTFPQRFWIYLAAAALVAAGFADFALMAFHFQKSDTVTGFSIPLFYAAAMAASGLGSLLFGKLFDRAGIVILVPLTVVTALFAPLVFLGGFWTALLGTILWGLGMGVHESIVPAAVAGMVPANRRASAYGLFTAGYGVAWFLGSAALGALYDVSLGAVVAFAVAVELAAVPLFLLVRKNEQVP